MRNNAFFAMGAVCLIAGCAGTGASYQPIVDGPITRAYTDDLSACRGVAQQRSYDNGEARTASALGATVVGLSAGLDDENDGDRLGSALGGALVGGLLGFAGSGFETSNERKEIVKDCMIGRGHRVVG